MVLKKRYCHVTAARNYVTNENATNLPREFYVACYLGM